MSSQFVRGTYYEEDYTEEELENMDSRRSDNSKVICPGCNHEFTAVPVDVQTERESLRTELTEAKDEIERLEGLVRTSYSEGYQNGYANDINHGWEQSDTSKAIKGAIEQVKAKGDEIERLTNMIGTWRKTNDDNWQELMDIAKAEIARLKGLINDHNKGCRSACVAMGKHRFDCEDYKLRGKDCPDCPKDWLIEQEGEL